MHKKLAIILCISLLTFATETRKKVVLLDTGISPEFPSKYLCSEGNTDFTGTNLEDRVHHGTHLAYILKEYVDPKKECLLILKFFNNTKSIQSGSLLKAYKHLRSIDIDFLNMSFGGRYTSSYEKETIKILLDKGVIIAVAAGNDGINLTDDCYYYPACYGKEPKKNFHVVGSCRNGKKESYSNYGTPPVSDCQNGTRVYAGPYVFTGSSQSTAIQLGELIKQHHSRDFHDH